MADARDSMNLLPESERQASESALKRAAKPGEKGDMKLVVPTLDAMKKEEASSGGFFKRRAARKAAKQADELRKKGETGSGAATPPPVVAARPPVPSVPAAQPVMPPATKPSAPVAMPSQPKVVPEIKKPEIKAEPSKPALMPLAAAVPKPKAQPKKRAEKPKPAPQPKIAESRESNKLHEPVAASEFSGPGVNLVPQDVVQASTPKPWVLYASVLALTVAVWVVLSGVSIARAKRAEARVSEWNARITQANAAIKNYDSGRIAAVALQKQFAAVQEQIEEHVYWTPFLQKLEETTIPDVYYMNISANRNGEIHLRAIAKTYAAAARQIRAFERSSSFVKDVTVNQASQQLQPGATLPVPVVAFDLQLKLQNGVLTIIAPEEESGAVGNPLLNAQQ